MQEKLMTDKKTLFKFIHKKDDRDRVTIKVGYAKQG